MMVRKLAGSGSIRYGSTCHTSSGSAGRFLSSGYRRHAVCASGRRSNFGDSSR